jgi:hypothetical protein
VFGQVHQDRAHSVVVILVPGEVELGEDRVDVPFHPSHGEEQPVGDDRVVRPSAMPASTSVSRGLSRDSGESSGRPAWSSRCTTC